MSTPLYDAVAAYLDRGASRFHMPGHKGNLPAFGDMARFDVTEVAGCDSLFDASGAISDCEARFARLYKSDASLLSAGGATLCIQTMLALAVKPGGKLILGRGCHISAINAMALLDIEPIWVFPEHDAITGLAKPVTAAQIADFLRETPGADAVYITSPDYYGQLADVKAIAAVCRSHDKPLLVDNAHGAHLRFLSPPLHPIALGAAMCSDSLHKSLPVLTGGALLHIGGARFLPNAKRMMSLFGSSSPSYPVMLSADLALTELERDYSGKIAKTANRVIMLKELAQSRGFTLPQGPCEPLRLSLGFAAAGFEKEEFAARIRAAGIEPELIDMRFCVLLAAPSNPPEDFIRLEAFLKDLPAKAPLPLPATPEIRPRAVKSLREAIFSRVTSAPIAETADRIAGGVVCPCPPGIPLLLPGEYVDKKFTSVLKNYGISRMNVLE